MRLISHTVKHTPRLSVVDGDRAVRLRDGYRCALHRAGSPDPEGVARSMCPDDLTQLLQLGAAGLGILSEVADYLAEEGTDELPATPLGEVRWAPAVPRPSKILCVGANNEELLRNTTSAPDHPLYFQKPPSSLLAHEADLEIPDVGVVHLESELALVIGKRARHVSADRADEYIFGYTILNDVTAVNIRDEDVIRVGIPTRDAETGERGHEDYTSTPMARHKGLDHFAPLGPWVVTKDEIPDPHALMVTGWMGDEIVNSGNTSTLKYKVPEVLAWISRWSTLYPGDIVTMGTAASTEEWPMRDADIRAHGKPVRIEIEGVGVLRNPIVAV